MPELPEVETVKKGLADFVVNKTIKSVEFSGKKLRFPYSRKFGKKILNKTILNIDRRAKYLLFYLSENYVIIAHLGMSGVFKIIKDRDIKKYKISKHDHMILYFDEGLLIYNDVRRFGYILLTANCPDKHYLLSSLGPEPLGNELNAEALAETFKGRKRPLKNTLLDQKIISGLGNIYVCEALFRSKILPTKFTNELVKKNGRAKKKLYDLVESINEVIREAIIFGGSSLKDFHHADGKLGYFQNKFKVYGRENESCLQPECKAKIKRIKQSNRSTFYCPKCQK